MNTQFNYDEFIYDGREISEESVSWKDIKIGDVVGSLDLYKDGKKISSFDITVKENVKKANIWDYYKRNIKSMISGQA